MAKLPSFQFYPGDWFKDPDLRRCSKSAKGVWIDMICLSFECKERGVFASGMQPWSDHEIAGALGGDIAENLSAIVELLAKGVCSRNESGAIFCRRVVRDDAIRRVKAANGQLGGRPKTKPETKRKPKRKLNKTTSSSSSSSSSDKPPLSPKGESPSAGISKKDLADVGRLREWHESRFADFGLKNDHATLFLLIAASERAIEVGRDAVACFIGLLPDVAKGDWSKISGEQENRAKMRLNGMQAESNGDHNDE